MSRGEKAWIYSCDLPKIPPTFRDTRHLSRVPSNPLQQVCMVQIQKSPRTRFAPAGLGSTFTGFSATILGYQQHPQRSMQGKIDKSLRRRFEPATLRLTDIFSITLDMMVIQLLKLYYPESNRYDRNFLPPRYTSFRKKILPDALMPPPFTSPRHHHPFLPHKFRRSVGTAIQYFSVLPLRNTLLSIPSARQN
jgi:hypothetical protein